MKIKERWSHTANTCTLPGLSAKIKFDLRVVHVRVFILLFHSETPTQVHLWGCKETFSAQGSCWICITSMMSLRIRITFDFFMDIQIIFWLLLIYDILLLYTKWKCFTWYLQCVLLVCFLKKKPQHISVCMARLFQKVVFKPWVHFSEQWLCSSFVSLFYLHCYSSSRN